VFWYTAFTASMVAPKSAGNNTVDAQGNLLWRMAPSPTGAYWKEGMQRGYQDTGSWTLLRSTPLERRKAAWLFAQFAVSKTVDLKKSHVGLTFVRDSTIRHQSFTERASKLGGMVEFYRSPDRVAWTPTGVNVPDYPRLAQLFWQHIGDISAGTFTAQQAMDRLAREMDEVMARMQAADEKAKTYSGCGPRLNKPEDPQVWLKKDGAPWAKLANEKPQGVTVAYDELIKRWTNK
jgi:glycerol transport system substrate-binding protein